MTHYDVLGVPPGAPPADVRRAFLALARRVHPDLHANEDASARRRAEARMQAVNDAWAVLGDAARRAAYDTELRRAARLAASTSSSSWSSAAPPSSSASSSSASSSSASAFGGTGGWARVDGAPAARPADWRRHASPGAGIGRSGWARSVAVLPAGLLVGAAALLGSSALLRVPELISLAVAVAIMAVLAFLAAPILAMKEARRAQRRPARPSSSPRRSARHRIRARH